MKHPSLNCSVPRNVIKVALGVVVGMAVGVTAASAAQSGSSAPTTIRACYERVLPHAMEALPGVATRCPAGYKFMTWNLQGVPGKSGTRGSQWNMGTGAPTTITGQENGDLYLDTSTGDVYEILVGAWSLQGNIKGAAGTNGLARDCSATPYPGINLDGCTLDTSAYFNVSYPGAQFAGASLVNTDVYGGSNFEDVNFSGATMTGDFLYNNADLSNANFTGANLTGAFLYSGANFTNANFTGANLTNTHLYSGGNFTNANFTGANLTGAFLSETTLSTAIWDNTTCPGGTNSSAYTPQTCVGH